MIGYVFLGLMVGVFVGVNLGVALMGVLAAAREWPREVDAES
jgi:hypothetical protein